MRRIRALSNGSIMAFRLCLTITAGTALLLAQVTQAELLRDGTSLDVVILVDQSPSMSGSSPAGYRFEPSDPNRQRIHAVKLFVDELKQETTKANVNTLVAIVNFGSRTEPPDPRLVPLQDLNVDEALFVEPIDGTNFRQALAAATTILADGRPGAKRLTLLVTDGDPQDTPRTDEEQSAYWGELATEINRLAIQHAHIYLLGMGKQQWQEQWIGLIAGSGRYIAVPERPQVQSLKAIVGEVVKELMPQSAVATATAPPMPTTVASAPPTQQPTMIPQASPTVAATEAPTVVVKRTEPSGGFAGGTAASDTPSKASADTPPPELLAREAHLWQAPKALTEAIFGFIIVLLAMAWTVGEWERQTRGRPGRRTILRLAGWNREVAAIQRRLKEAQSMARISGVSPTGLAAADTVFRAALQDTGNGAAETAEYAARMASQIWTQRLAVWRSDRNQQRRLICDAAGESEGPVLRGLADALAARWIGRPEWALEELYEIIEHTADSSRLLAALVTAPASAALSSEHTRKLADALASLYRYCQLVMTTDGDLAELLAEGLALHRLTAALALPQTRTVTSTPGWPERLRDRFVSWPMTIYRSVTHPWLPGGFVPWGPPMLAVYEELSSLLAALDRPAFLLAQFPSAIRGEEHVPSTVRDVVRIARGCFALPLEDRLPARRMMPALARAIDETAEPNGLERIHLRRISERWQQRIQTLSSAPRLVQTYG